MWAGTALGQCRTCWKNPSLYFDDLPPALPVAVAAVAPEAKRSKAPLSSPCGSRTAAKQGANYMVIATYTDSHQPVGFGLAWPGSRPRHLARGVYYPVMKISGGKKTQWVTPARETFPANNAAGHASPISANLESTARDKAAKGSRSRPKRTQPHRRSGAPPARHDRRRISSPSPAAFRLGNN